MYKKILTFILPLFTSVYASGETLLIVGDSISAGYGIEAERGWVSLLETRLKEQQYNYKIINSSISGDTTANGLVRLPTLLDEHKPAVVVIEMGGNDGLRGTSPKKIKQNLQQMVVLSKKAGATPLLLGIELPPNYGVAYLKRFMAIFHEVADEEEIALLPSIVANVGGRSELMQTDGIHPNVKGQSVLLEDIWAKLWPLLHK